MVTSPFDESEDEMDTSFTNSTPELSHDRGSIMSPAEAATSTHSSITGVGPPPPYHHHHHVKDILHLACRTGNLEQVKFLVDQKGMNVNETNIHDATPLYYASLCGHVDVCKFLLDNGAQCDENDFVGERVFYAALTPSLRKLLKSYKLTAATRDPFLEFLRRTFDRRTEFADCNLILEIPSLSSNFLPDSSGNSSISENQKCSLKKNNFPSTQAEIQAAASVAGTNDSTEVTVNRTGFEKGNVETRLGFQSAENGKDQKVEKRSIIKNEKQQNTKGGKREKRDRLTALLFTGQSKDMNLAREAMKVKNKFDVGEGDEQYDDNDEKEEMEGEGEDQEEYESSSSTIAGGAAAGIASSFLMKTNLGNQRETKESIPKQKTCVLPHKPTSSTFSSFIFPCHKLFLSTRSPFFKRKFQRSDRSFQGEQVRMKGGRKEKVARIKVKGRKESWLAILQYIYIGRIEVAIEFVGEVIKIANRLEMYDVEFIINKYLEEVMVKRGSSYIVSKINLNQETDLILKDFGVLSASVLTKFRSDADLCVYVDGKCFALHKSILCNRSDYWSRMLTGNFREGACPMREKDNNDSFSGVNHTITFPTTATTTTTTATATATLDSNLSNSNLKSNLSSNSSFELDSDSESTTLPTISLDGFSKELFEIILEYIYSDQVVRAKNLMILPLLYDILDAATIMMLDGLRTICVNTLVEVCDISDVFFNFSIAQIYDLPKLENYCFEVFAQHLEEVIDTEEFKELVLESGLTIKERQETDSIPFIDEIRFQIHRKYTNKQNIVTVDGASKYELIDQLLAELKLRG